MYRFVPAKLEHVKPLVDDILIDIEKEMLALKNVSVSAHIKATIVSSDEAWTAFYNDDIICMFGIGSPSLLSNRGFPWLISTNLIHAHKRNFLRGAKLSIEYWLQKYDVLENYIPIGLHKLLRWAKWAGFTVHPAATIGTGGLLHRIEMRKQ